MKRKLVKITSGIMIVILLLLTALSLGGALFVGVSYFMKEVSALSYAYLLMGELIMPVETLINKGVGKFPEETIKIFIIVIGVIVGVLCIICIKIFSKATKGKKGVKPKFFVPSLILQLLLGGYFAFNGIYTILNFNSYNKFVNKRVADGVVKNILSVVGDNFITIKGLAVCGLTVILSLVLFVTYIFCKEKRPRQMKIVTSLNFYSEDFLKEPTNNKETNNKDESTQTKDVVYKPKPKKQSQDLINRIMQLNELRDTNQISEVEYTKLRTKAIRRYKG